MPSSLQSVTERQVFDYIYAGGDPTATTAPPVKGAIVTAILNYNQASVTSPIVNLGPRTVQAVTDSNGQWVMNLVPNDTITPSGTLWTIQTPFSSYDISVPSGAGQVQSSSILANQPSTLSPALTNLTGPITVTGNETVTGNLTVNGTTTLAGTNTGALAVSGNETVSGTEVVSGDLTANARLIMGAASAKILGGATQTSIRDHADTTDVLVIFGGTTVKVASGDLQISGGNLVLFNATSRIVPGGTSLGLRNNANSADNLLILDGGASTFRGPVTVPAGVTGGNVAHGMLSAIASGNLTLSASLQTVPNCTLSLTAGTWLIWAKGDFNTSTAAQHPYTAVIIDTTNSTTLDTSIATIEATGGTIRVPFVLMATVTLAATHSIALQANTDSASGTQLASDGVIAAVQVA